MLGYFVPKGFANEAQPNLQSHVFTQDWYPLANDYQTLAVFLLDKLQRFPRAGESLDYGNWNFTVVSTVGPRIDRVRVRGF